MSKYFKEIALKKYGSVDMVHLDFVITTNQHSPPITVVIRDTRGKTKHTHILHIDSDAERKALIEGFHFFANTLKESCFSNECC